MGKEKHKKAKRPDWMPKDMQLLGGDTMVKWDGTIVMGQSAGAHIGTFVDEAADIHSSEILRLMAERMQMIPERGTWQGWRVPLDLIYCQADEAGVSFQHAARWFGVDWRA